MLADLRPSHANLDAELPAGRWVENLAWLNLHWDAEVSRPLASDRDDGSAVSHELCGPARSVSLTVLVVSAFVAKLVTDPRRDTDIVDAMAT
jgi:hypothetical protein